MTRFLSLIFALVLLRTEAVADSFRIGVIAPLSGDVAAWGQDVKNSLVLANETFGEGRFTFIFEDDRCLGKEAVTAAQKLIAIDKIDFGMVVCTESMLASAPIFEKSKTIVITPVATGAAVSTAGDFVFRTWPSDALGAALLFRYVSKIHSQFGILTEERGYPAELTNSFLAADVTKSLHIRAETFHSYEMDYRNVLLRLKSKGVDGLLINTNSERAYANVLKELKEIKWGPKAYGVYMPGNKAFLELAGALAQGIVFVDAPSADDSLTGEGRRIYRQFLERFGSPRSASFVVPATIEAFRLIAGGSKIGKDLRAYLYSNHFSGVFGDYGFDRNGDIQGVSHRLKVVGQGGKISVLSAEEAAS